MRQFGKVGRALFALFGAFAALPTAALLVYILVTSPESRDFDTWFGLISLLAGAAVCFRVAWTGNPGAFLSRRVTTEGVEHGD